MNQIYINFNLAVFGMVVTVVALRGIRMISVQVGRDRKYLQWMILSNQIYLLSVVADSYFSGKPGATVHSIMLIANTIEYLGLYMLCASLTAYMAYLIRKAGDTWFPVHIVMGYYLIPIVSLLISCFNEMYFYIGEDNCYHVGDYFFISQVFGGIALAMNLILLVLFYHRFKKNDRRLFIVAIAAPSFAVLIQTGWSIKFMVIATTICCLTMLLTLLERSHMEYAEKLLELERIQSTMTYTQLHPHFLYNSLSTISILSKKQPERGAALADQVSEFLRKSTEDMTHMNLNPFQEEFDHAANYLQIEQTRYGEDLQVEYDICDTEFKLPGFVLQQLVELLIRYEFIRMEDRMTIGITTALTQKGHKICVISSGDDPIKPIFGRRKVTWTKELDPIDPQYPELKELQTIRERLSAIPGADLEAEALGIKGTLITILIPLEGESKDENTCS